MAFESWFRESRHPSAKGVTGWETKGRHMRPPRSSEATRRSAVQLDVVSIKHHVARYWVLLKATSKGRGSKQPCPSYQASQLVLGPCICRGPALNQGHPIMKARSRRRAGKQAQLGSGSWGSCRGALSALLLLVHQGLIPEGDVVLVSSVWSRD